MTTTTAGVLEELDSSSDVLTFARSSRREADRAEARVLAAAVTWAEQHPPESIHHAATWVTAGGDTGLLLAGPGAPLWSRSSASPSSPWLWGSPPTPDAP